MNLNKLAQEVTLKEGKKLNLSIAQVKEVSKILFTKLANMDLVTITTILKKYSKKK